MAIFIRDKQRWVVMASETCIQQSQVIPMDMMQLLFMAIVDGSWWHPRVIP